MDRAPQVAVAQHPKPEKRQGHRPREEYAPDPGRYVRERVPHAADDEVLEGRRPPHERRLVLAPCEEPVAHELIWQLEY